VTALLVSAAIVLPFASLLFELGVRWERTRPTVFELPAHVVARHPSCEHRQASHVRSLHAVRDEEPEAVVIPIFDFDSDGAA
jgi:hypothetical protein